MIKLENTKFKQNANVFAYDVEKENQKLLF